jgi:uncharacterized protein
MSNQPFNPATERYVSLATYRSNGTEVTTPVWLAQAGEHFYVFSEGDAFKVKRIRANPQARIAPCDLRGKINGPWLDMRGRIVEEDGLKTQAYAALLKKYGWQMGLLNFFSALSGKKNKRALIELRLVDR